MAALTSDRNTPQASGDLALGEVGAGVLIFAGALICRNAAGYLVPGTTATGLIGVGRASERVDNTGGANGAKSVKYTSGVFLFANSAGADELGRADIGRLCFVVDDQSVAKTDGGATRSRAGVVQALDTNGVWVRFDEPLTRAI